MNPFRYAPDSPSLAGVDRPRRRGVRRQWGSGTQPATYSGFTTGERQMSNQTRYLLLAVLACCTAPLMTPASAAALPTYAGLGITGRRHLSHEILNPGFGGMDQVSVGVGLDFACLIKASTRRNPGWSIGMYMNGRPLKSKRSTDPTLKQSGGAFTLYVGNWKPTSPGVDTVECRLKLDGFSTAPPPRRITFRVAPRVGSSHASPRHLFARRHLTHGATVEPNLHTSMMSRHTKVCKGTLTADVTVQPSELDAPAWKPEADGVQVPHIMLHLKRSSAAGNSVTCTYATTRGDVRLTTNLECKNAQKRNGANSYYCE